MSAERRPLPASLIGTAFRPARADDLPACAAIWREALNDYLEALNLEAIPDELGPIGRLHAHTLATDPDRFVVATVPAAGGSRIVGFGAAVERGSLWFLSMLFVLPEAQGQGLGRAILERILPAPDRIGTLATAVDSLQPISIALYSTYGIVPRMPILDMRGEIRPAGGPAAAPVGHRVDPVRDDRRGPDRRVRSPRARGHRDALDRELLGSSIPTTTASCAAEGRQGFLYRGPDGAPLGYGYAGAVGRIGPIAIRTARSSRRWSAISRPPSRRAAGGPSGRSAAAPRLVPTLLAAGLRTDGRPLLLCWDRPFADFARYVPISPGLL